MNIFKSKTPIHKDRNTRSKSTMNSNLTSENGGKRRLTVSSKIANETFGIGTRTHAKKVVSNSTFHEVIESTGTNLIPSPKVRPFDSPVVATAHLNKPGPKKPKTITDSLNTSAVLKYIRSILEHVPEEVLLLPAAQDCSDESAEQFDETVVERMTYKRIANHLSSLRMEHVQKILRPLITKLILNPKNLNIFNKPVDPVALQLPDYFTRITNPMDLGTIKSRNQRGFYDCVATGIDDISQVFKNAMIYNPASHYIHQIAKQLKQEFESDLQALDERCIKEADKRAHHSCSLCQGATCPLCGEKCLKFESPVLVCYGTCLQRIKRNSTYYIAPDGGALWCQKCYCALPTEISDGCGSLAILKSSLLKRKSDEEVAEPWVNCDTCGHWVHQICALYTVGLEDASDNVMDVETEDTDGISRKFECALCKVERLWEKYPAPIDIPAKSIICSSTVTAPKRRGRKPKSKPVILSAEKIRGLLPKDLDVSVKSECVELPLNLPVSKSNDLVEISLDSRTEEITADILDDEYDLESKVISDSNSTAMLGHNDDDLPDNDSSGIMQKCDINRFTYEKEDGVIIQDLKRQRMDIDAVSKFQHADEDDEVPDEVAVVSPVDVDTEEDHVHLRYLKDVVSGDDLRKKSSFLESPFEDTKLLTKAPNLAPVISFGETVVSCHHESDVNRSPASEWISTPMAVQSNVLLNLICDGSVTDREEIEECIGDIGETDATLSQEFEVDKISDEELSKSLLESDTESSTTVSAIGSSAEETLCHLTQQESQKTLEIFAPHSEDSGPLKFSEVLKSEDVSKPNMWIAASLPRSKLSDFIEAMVFSHLKNSGFGNVAESLTIRMTSNVPQIMHTPNQISSNFSTASGNKVPKYLPYRQKSILLFQNIDGVDVCLFSLYVHEFDASCPEPNNSVVYIAYLDSVDYFRPIEARTLVYHEIIVAYLKWVQMRGFRQGHIWACPPQRGDNFIFWCHPHHQRTPSRDRLTSWYASMLKRCGKLGFLSKVESLHDCYFKSHSIHQIRREGGSQRQAARNSYVGSGKSAIRVHGNSAIGIALQDKETGTALRSTSDDLAATNNGIIPSAAKLINGYPPIAPPIFEGDFWILECSRLYTFLQSKAAQGLSPKDIVQNQRRARDLLKSWMLRREAEPFCSPVDPIAMKLPNYFDIVKTPMDFSIVKSKQKSHSYPSMLDMIKDVRLIMANAKLFNPPTTSVHILAEMLSIDIEESLREFLIETAGAYAELRNMDEILASYLLVDPNNSNPASPGYSPRLTEGESQSSGHFIIPSATFPDLAHDPVDEGCFQPMSALCSVDTIEDDSAIVTQRSSIPKFSFDESLEKRVTFLQKNLFQAENIGTMQQAGPHRVEGCSEAFTDKDEGENVVVNDDQSDLMIVQDNSIDMNDEGNNHRVNFSETVLFEPSEGDDSSPCTSNMISDHHVDDNDQYPQGRLHRSDSICSINSNTSHSVSGSNFESDPACWTIRMPPPIMNHDNPSESDVQNQVCEPFDVAELGIKGVLTLMSELHKTTLRLKDDLFVIKFAPPSLRRISSSPKKIKTSDGNQMEVESDDSTMDEIFLDTSFGSTSSFEKSGAVTSQNSFASASEHGAEDFSDNFNYDNSSAINTSESAAECEANPAVSSSFESDMPLSHNSSEVMDSETKLDTEHCIEESACSKDQENLLSLLPPEEPYSEDMSVCNSDNLSATSGGVSVVSDTKLKTAGIPGRRKLMTPRGSHNRRKGGRHRGRRMPLNSPRVSAANRANMPPNSASSMASSLSRNKGMVDIPSNESEFETIPEACIEMLSSLQPDTSDPDELIKSPFVDSRHTFLEMCQFRHYQFDTLRRAKHSSLMLLYHLHHPFAPHTRPICESCHDSITQVRWHCEQCANYDICSTCYEASKTPEGLVHDHALTPFRVTFV